MFDEDKGPLGEPVTHLPGIGPRRAALLAALNIHTIRDILYYFPFRYEDLRLRRPDQWADGQRVAVVGTPLGPAATRRAGKRVITSVPLDVQGSRLYAVWFYQPYVGERLKQHRFWRLVGRWQASRGSLVVDHMEPAEPGSEASHHAGRIIPVYRVAGELRPKWLREWIALALRKYGDHLTDPLPWRWRQRMGLMDKREAMREIHFPTGWDRLKRARDRLVYEECLRFQLPLQWMRCRRNRGQALPIRLHRETWERFLAALPFSPTPDQRRALREVAGDLAREEPMRRLILGDVGSGKTVIAAAALFAAAAAGAQGAMLAPTEILAEQHYRVLSRWFAGLGFAVWLLTGSVRGREREECLRDMAEGRPGIAVGTHALLGDVPFQKLAVAVCDEQHRFGVLQRMALAEKGHQTPHLLSLSATPIPRTLAMALYGDLDVSFLTGEPARHRRRVTRWLPLERREEVVLELRRRLARGERGYLVAPVIDGGASEGSEPLTDVLTLYEEMKEKLAGFAVGLLHGRMSSEEKEEAMRAFAEGRLQALVATTVVEVGVDVPEATVMAIYHAERFGLSQLHQLRGRVGRRGDDAVCYVLTGALTEAAKRRIEAFCSTDDGFVLAQKDLELRGPGEWAGLVQSGWPKFALVDLSRDARWMRRAKLHAYHLVRREDFWLLPAYTRLRAPLLEMDQPPASD